MVSVTAISARPGRRDRPVRFELPSSVHKIAPDVFALGTTELNGRPVEGYAFVHYRQGHAKPGTVCGNGVCEPSENVNKCPEDCGGSEEPSTDDSGCYTFLAKGAKWLQEEPYYVNADNSEGLTATFVADNLSLSIDKWESAAETTAVLGAGSLTTDILVADTEAPDEVNEVYFGDIAEEGAIGVTVIWGVFTGPPWARELVEWDMIFDQADFDWSSSGELAKMDFESIATHELGHAAGLGDLYEEACSEQTMFGYASNGETKKRTLEAGDIAGIQELY